MPRRGAGDGSGPVTMAEAMSLSVDSLMCAREKNKQEKFRFHGRIQRLNMEEKQMTNICSSDIKDARKNLIKITAYKSVYTRYSFDKVLEGNKKKRAKENNICDPDPKMNSISIEYPQVPQRKDYSSNSAEEEGNLIDGVAVECAEQTSSAAALSTKEDSTGTGIIVGGSMPAAGEMTNDNAGLKKLPVHSTGVSTRMTNMCPDTVLSTTSSQLRQSRGRPPPQAMNALACHIAAHPEVCMKQLPSKYKYRGKSAPEQIYRDVTAKNGNKGAAQKGLLSSENCFQSTQEPAGETHTTSIDESPNEQSVKRVIIHPNKQGPSDGNNGEAHKTALVANLTTQNDNIEEERRNERLQEAEIELYNLASALATRPSFRIEHDVLPANEPSLVRNFNKDRHKLIHGRPRSDAFPADCKNMFTFRQFIDRQARQVELSLSPDQIRAHKLQRIGEKVAFPDIINTRKTTSAIFRDYRTYRSGAIAGNPHAHTLSIYAPPTAVDRPKSPMTRLRERVLMIRRAQTTL